MLSQISLLCRDGMCQTLQISLLDNTKSNMNEKKTCFSQFLRVNLKVDELNIQFESLSLIGFFLCLFQAWTFEATKNYSVFCSRRPWILVSFYCVFGQTKIFDVSNISFLMMFLLFFHGQRILSILPWTLLRICFQNSFHSNSKQQNRFS